MDGGGEITEIKDNLKSSLAKHPFSNRLAEYKTLSQMMSYKRQPPNHSGYKNI